MAATEIVAGLDAGSLIHLDELGRLNLLNDFKELLVPQTVLNARGGQFLLSDDAAARTVARAVGFQTHGTIGLVLRACRRGKISKAEMLRLLRELPVRTTLHLRKELLDSILTTATAENT